MLGNLVGGLVSRGFSNQNNRKAGNIFDYKPSSMSTFGFNTDLKAPLGSSEFFKDGMGSAYPNIFTPKEEKERSGPFNFLKNQISKLQEDEENDKEQDVENIEIDINLDDILKKSIIFYYSPLL